MTQPSSLRIDKWLFHARIIKSRSLAAKFVASGALRINGEKISAPSRTIKPGDTLTLTRSQYVQILKIVACGTRRGPAPEAQTLYEDLSPPKPKKSQSPLDKLVPRRDPGSGRPTKRERRQIDQLHRSKD